jgi:ArsR family transcriptional regulator, arsenate/arsenite/antimonite-responsive transcriptional repressor
VISGQWSVVSVSPLMEEIRFGLETSFPSVIVRFRHCVGRPLLDIHPYFCKHRTMKSGRSKASAGQVVKYADMFSAMGTEPRLRIMQLLLSAHPEGLVVGEIQEELDIPGSTLSHHLDKLKAEKLVDVHRESTFLRYTASTDALQELLQFLYAECCTRNKALKPEQIVRLCK